MRECAESKEIPVSEFKILSLFFPALEHIQYVKKKKRDGNRSVQYTGVKSIHKASCSNVLLAPLLSSRAALSHSLHHSVFNGKTPRVSRRCGTDLSVWVGLSVTQFSLVFSLFSEIMLRTYWRVMPWRTIVLKRLPAMRIKKGEESARTFNLPARADT